MIPKMKRGFMIMKHLLVSTALVALGTSAAMAGGLDRSGQGIGTLFETGNYVELSYGMVQPTITGVLGGVLNSGDVGSDYSQFSIGVKTDVSDKLSFALIVDQPFGAAVDYTNADPGYAIMGNATANVSSQAATILVRYKLSDRFSVHAGLRQQSISGDATIPGLGYALDVTGSSGTGYAVGGAFEIPDIALRAALTYNSEITHTMTGTEGGGATSFDLVTPDSINFDFQTGIAADTLLFGSIRWVNWSDFNISPPIYTVGFGGPLVSYSDDVVSYSLGIGRKFSDSFSGSIALGYEAATGTAASNLAPTDGRVSITVGGKYTMGDTEISAGVSYINLGDTTTETISAAFADNSALGVGVKVGFRF